MKYFFHISGTHLQKTLSAVILFIAISTNGLFAQSFDEGVNLYEQGEYKKAATIFNALNSDRARLFSGKSYFSLGKYITSKVYLQQVDQTANRDIYLEAQYNIALADFQQGLYGEALNTLYPFFNEEPRTQVVSRGIQLYEDILPFLTLNQRKNAFQNAISPQIQYDLVASAIGRVDYPVARMMYNQLKKVKIDTTSPSMQKLADMVTDSVTYSSHKIYAKSDAPDGITYNIGVALPSYKPGAPEFEISRGLYFGYLLAAEEFNSRNTDKKAFIRYQNTSAEADSARYSISNLVWNYNADAILGPLFSGPAQSMAKLAELYQVPMIPPMANSDKLNMDNPYVFQINPPLSSHGKRMAEYAVNKLQMDTLAIIVEKGSLGETSAFAFKERAGKLGAHVAYFFTEDFSSQGFDLTDYTKYFTTDKSKRDSLDAENIDGIYAPFTGQGGPTLAELLFVDLEAMDSSLPILGTQVWGNLNIPEDQIGNRDIYFSESYYQDSNNPDLQQFRKAYKERFNIEPNRFSMIGYDAANFVLNALVRVGNPALLKNALKNQQLYEGLMGNIFLDGTRVNQEIKIFEIGEQGIQPVMNQ